VQTKTKKVDRVLESDETTKIDENQSQFSPARDQISERIIENFNRHADSIARWTTDLV